MAHHIDSVKYERYLGSLNEKDAQYVRTIVDNLIYISTKELVEMVRRSVRKFTATHDKYNLYVPGDKIGSEHYLMLQLKDELHPVSVVKGLERITNEYPLLILDDAIYSSVNMCSIIDNYRYHTGYQNKLYIAVGILSTTKVDLLSHFDFNVKVIADRICDDLLPASLFPDYDWKYFYEAFGCETDCVIPIYFEHKIANAFGTYPFIQDITAIPISRHCINVITQQDIDTFITEIVC